MLHLMRNGTAAPYVWPVDLPPLLSAALDHPKIGSLVFGPGLRLLHATKCAESLLGWPVGAAVQGADLRELIASCAAIDSHSRLLLESKVADSASGDSSLNLSSLDGSRTVAVETRRIGEDCWIATFEDITTRCQNESHLLSLALRDPLTGLGNRARFERSLTDALESPAAYAAILLVDLDRFKSVNDTLGHQTGDAVLRLVAQRLQSAVRESDMIARLGGDEFAILVTETMTSKELQGLAARLVDLLQRTYLVGGQVANIGASVGVAVAPKDGSTSGWLIKSADLALYEVKSSGKSNFLFFEPFMEQRAQARRQLELELRKALPLRQLEVHYKPQVDISTKSLLGFEALVRWRHPALGLLRWEDFQAVADGLRLTVQIADWLLRTACREAALWPQSLSLSVATSPLQFESSRLVESVKRAIAASGIEGSQLEITITESILLQNERSVLDALHELRALGVRVAMDGFGTGYASLRQLASFPFDRVNINRSLLTDRFSNERHRAIVRAITALGASLGICTMADGIETPVELARIHSYGCESLQGYLSGEPVTAVAIPEMIAGSTDPSMRAPVSALEEIRI